MKILVVTGGTCPSLSLLNKYIEKSDYIIGVDSGCNVLYKYNIMPNLIVGDFDSGDENALKFFKDKNIEVRKYSTHKDYTDTHLAYNIAKDLNAKEIYLLGATGSRLDHMLGNIGLFLNSLEDNINLIIEDDNNLLFLGSKNKKIRKEKGKTLSFHALSDVVKDFSIKGAMYELEKYDLKLFEPRAISNEFLETDVSIDFKEGNILVLLTND